jgi:hypothetical protein
MSGRALSVVLAALGAAPMVALAALSFVSSDVWAWWSGQMSGLVDTARVAQGAATAPDRVFNALASPWMLLLPLAYAAFTLAVAWRSTASAWVVTGLALLSQLPGIVAHTQFQWMSLMGSSAVFTAEPHIGIVSAALVATVAGAYMLGAAAQMKNLAARFEAGRVDRDEARQALLPNFVMAALVPGAVLVAGVAMAWVAIGLGKGLSILLTEKAHFGVWLMWTLPPVAFAAIAVAFAYVHRRVAPEDQKAP